MDEDDEYGPVADGGGADDGLGMLLQQLSSIQTTDPDDLVRQWSAIMAVSAEEAHFFLAAAQFKLETAISLYLDSRAGAVTGAREHRDGVGGGAIGASALVGGVDSMISPGTGVSSDDDGESSPMGDMLASTISMRREQELLLAAAAASGRRETVEERFEKQMKIALELSMAASGAAAPAATSSAAAGSAVPTLSIAAAGVGGAGSLVTAAPTLGAGGLPPSAPPPAPPDDGMLE